MADSTSSAPSGGTLSQRPTLHVSVGTDENYLPWCATTLLSALLATPGARLHVHLLAAADVSDAAIARMASMVTAHGGELTAVRPDLARLGRLPSGVRAHGGAISCARLLLPEQLDDVDRIVYLDADTLVRRSLLDLVQVDLSGRPIAAVRNVVHPEMRQRLRTLGLQPDDYFNSGVLLLDVPRIRADHAMEGALRHIETWGEQLLWVDQDALNLAFAGNWTSLPPAWNAQNSLWHWPGLAGAVFGDAAVQAATGDPAVVHFEGPWLRKPWHYLCDHPFVADYRAVLDRTPWAGAALEDRTVATRLIRRLPPGQRVGAYLRLRRTREWWGRRRTGPAGRPAPAPSRDR